jgi:hypothetical protein
MSDYKVGKTQTMVLNALGITNVIWFDRAEQAFAELGLIVRSKRVGRSVQPEIIVQPRFGGGFTADGDGESFRQYPDIDTTPIQQWIVKS